MTKKSRGIIIEALGLIIGCLSMSIGLNMFLGPHTIAPGGLSGLSVVISKLTGLSVSTIMLMMGIPLIICSVKILGKKDAAKTLIGMLTLSFLLEVTSPLANISATQDTLLSAISGAILLGSGIGIVFSVDGSTGGTDLIALMVNRVFPSIPLSKCLTFIDGMVVISAGIANGNLETGLYSAIALYIIVKMIDAIVSGFDYSKAFMIITEEEEVLRDAIVNDVKRGLTIIDAKGGYTSQDKRILLVVVRKKQEVHLKKLIKRVDPKAFIIVSDVHEVLGEGFTPINV
ncbi:YitT family protein [Romboutsia ilealis]|uniref:YitT family protein n=1 Tax=Romboutsia faecis TaxID=2764597 RepID=A0ABR7JLI9_9FIRM|nr:YitT family protein [Romboutsia faecis]MBC5995794.1 YitT family protein [Romboutsia faecis]MRN22993.1 YitT family protein [Romboutsia ilealis]